MHVLMTYHLVLLTYFFVRFQLRQVRWICVESVCAYIASLTLLSFLSSALGCGDNNGWLPLHVASRRGLPIYIIQQLLDCFPPSVDMVTKKGSTPLMCARKGGDSQHHIDVIQFLQCYIQRQLVETGKKLDSKNDDVTTPDIPTIRHRNVHAKGA
jgi:ankyrin repeat protein